MPRRRRRCQAQSCSWSLAIAVSAARVSCQTDVRATVVIPTVNARELLTAALASLERQTVPMDIVVVDNASMDGTSDYVSRRFPDVRVVRNETNLGFGRAINRVALALEGDVLVLVNNDVVCEPTFVERMCAPFTRKEVGMVAGVLTQGRAPERIDSAGIELDPTLRSWDYLWNEPVEVLSAPLPDPVGPCGGAAAYRLVEFQRLGGFDETLFAYWEDVDLAIRFRLAGWQCALAPDARAEHHHGATIGAATPLHRRLEAFGRGHLLAKYRVATGRPLRWLGVAAIDWPVLFVHLTLRRDPGPLRARWSGLRAGQRSRIPGPPPLELATVSLGEALRRQLRFLGLRLGRRLPAHYYDRSPAAGVNPGVGRRPRARPTERR